MDSDRIKILQKKKKSYRKLVTKLVASKYSFCFLIPSNRIKKIKMLVSRLLYINKCRETDRKRTAFNENVNSGCFL